MALISMKMWFNKPEELAVLEARADVGFAFDGDGDRVVAVQQRKGFEWEFLYLLCNKTSGMVGTTMSGS